MDRTPCEFQFGSTDSVIIGPTWFSSPKFNYQQETGAADTTDIE